MEKQELEATVKKIVSENLGVELESVENHKSFVDLGADSLALVELIMAFEDEFKVEIPDDLAEKIKTVQDAIDSLEKMVK